MSTVDYSAFETPPVSPVYDCNENPCLQNERYRIIKLRANVAIKVEPSAVQRRKQPFYSLHRPLPFGPREDIVPVRDRESYMANRNSTENATRDISEASIVTT
ncbi:hypothetical protein CBL_03579 [Carabus blaptoides fortunei]